MARTEQCCRDSTALQIPIRSWRKGGSRDALAPGAHSPSTIVGAWNQPQVYSEGNYLTT